MTNNNSDPKAQEMPEVIWAKNCNGRWTESYMTYEPSQEKQNFWEEKYYSYTRSDLAVSRENVERLIRALEKCAEAKSPYDIQAIQAITEFQAKYGESK